ncbi:hypothetical protein BH09VER1_BH09VER1_23480 [soil metagenome]
MATESASLEDVSRSALRVGRLLFQNNADTEAVETGVERFTKTFGYESHPLVTYETILLTIASTDGFRTKAGHRVPAMNVNMAAVAAVNTLIDEVEAGRLALADVPARLDAIEHQRPIYSRWMMVAGLSLTAASLSRLFGGDWPTFFVTFVAGAVGTWLRQELGKHGANLFLTTFLGAMVSGIVAGLAVHFNLSGMAALCLVAPGMIIVPGVPLVNCVQDMIKNHMAIGISRLGLASLITLAIAMGLFVATAITGAQIPVAEAGIQIPVLEDALFSALAAVGYLFIFNVPIRLAWVGVLCGVASHTTRTFCEQIGINIVTGSLIGALAVGFLAQGFARYFRAPASAFAFPGVVAMIPGAFAFRAVIGYLQIIKAGSGAELPLMAETLSLSATAVFMVMAIAIGVAAPLILLRKADHS